MKNPILHFLKETHPYENSLLDSYADIQGNFKGGEGGNFIFRLCQETMTSFSLGCMCQEKMKGQRGRLPVQALGYVNSTKVILGLPETAGVHFLLRPHHYILKVITQFRNGGPRTNTAMEASFTGTLERNGISGWINQRGICIFTTCWE